MVIGDLGDVFAEYSLGFDVTCHRPPSDCEVGEVSRPNVVIIGAGMAGLTAAHQLQAKCNVVVVDKGRGVGGRLATRRIGDATLDHGAQFMTTHTAEFAGVMAQLAGAGVATEWFHGRIGPSGAHDSDGHPRYRGVVSMNAVAKQLATGIDVRTSSLVKSVVSENDVWNVHMEDGTALVAHAVISTAPVPQTLALLENGDVALAVEDEAALLAVSYDPCLALMAVLDGPSGLVEPGAVDPDDGPIDWMADNAIKGISAVPAVTIHATAEFSRANWDASNDAIAEQLLLAADLASTAVIDSIQVQRWRYARPSVEHPERFLQLVGLPPFVCAGDAFGGAKVEGAALSGSAAASAVTAALGIAD